MKPKTWAISVAILAVSLLWTTGASPALAQCQANELAKLLASDGAAGDRLGHAPAVDADRLRSGAERRPVPEFRPAAGRLMWPGTVGAGDRKPLEHRFTFRFLEVINVRLQQGEL